MAKKRKIKGKYSASSRGAISIDSDNYDYKFTILDIGSDSNSISDSNDAENIGFFTNSITDIQITDIQIRGNGNIIKDPAIYPEASLLVETEQQVFGRTTITYSLVDNEGLFLGVSKVDGSIVSTKNLRDPDIIALSFTLYPDTFKEINLDLAVNSLDYIIEENLLPSSSIEIFGTNEADNLSGDFGDDLLKGESGNDTLLGDFGKDVILGDNDDDLLLGEEDNDTLFGGNGNDTVSGGIGNDRLFGSPGNDFLSGDEGNDLINGDDDNDSILGGTGNDSLSGGNGNDTLSGGNGDDIIEGNSGDDLLIAGNGDDILKGGDGVDTFELGVPNSSAFAVITDFNRSEGDKFKAVGNQSDYALSLGRLSGDAAVDTLIEYQGETIAIAEDTVTVDLNTDFVFF